MSNSEEGALAGVRILDLSDERNIYGAKLLADLGADVVRPEIPIGDPLRKRGPTAKDGTSLWHLFFASNRRFIALDMTSTADVEKLQELGNRADIVLTQDSGFGNHFDIQVARKANNKLIIVDTTSFGREGPWANFKAPDLIAGALAGAVATTGDKDTPPLKTFGELNFIVSGTYCAIAALSALHETRHSGEGQRVDVSVHECITSCLEQVLMWYWYHDRLTMADGPVMPRQGAVHWTGAYVVMQAKGGSIMVTPAPDLQAQLAWLVEEGVHEDLLDPKYQEPENYPLLVMRLMGILRAWVAEQDVETLFEKAQARHMPYGWVLPMEKVGDNPQLNARHWWVPYRAGELETTGPGAPYHFSDTPWQMDESESFSISPQQIMNELGWEDRT